VLGFEELKLGEILTFQRGFDITKKEQSLGSVPIVSSSGISSFHNKAKLKSPGVVIGRKGTLGTVHYIKQDFWPHDTTLWVKDFKGNDPRFLSYFLKTLHLEAFDTGSSNPTLNRNHLHKIKVLFPKPKNQKKIAAILSAYDDLIENNKRRIALLEKMAEEIYREWFVRFRFPGYQTAEFEKGIPKGWTQGTLGEIATMLMGQSPKSEFYNESGDGLPFHQGVGTYGARFPKNETYCSVDGRTANEGDILFSVRAPVGRLNIANTKMIIGRGLAALSHKQGLNSYLLYLLKTVFAHEDIIGNGSIFNSVGKDELRSFNLLLPPHHLANKYDGLAANIDEQIKLLLNSVESLNKSKEMLLPRLISGKLSVEDLDIQFPPSMEEAAED
jgi:type I restriction enzyme S subunit